MRIASPLALLLLATALAPAGALAQQDSPPPAIAVTGSAEVQAAPDRATVRLGVEASEPTAQAAIQQVNTSMQQVIASIRALEIPEERIQSARVTLIPIHAPRPPREELPQVQIIGYRATNTVTVDIREELDRVGPVIDAGLGAGANRVEGISYSLIDDTPQRLEALGAAARQARQKADALANALGVPLGQPLEVTEGAQVFRPMYEMARAGFAGDAPTPVQPGLITVQAEVSVRYRIEQ